MRSYTGPELTYLQNRSAYVAKALLCVSARNRATNVFESWGLWTGDDDASFIINGAPRAYQATGAILSLDALVMQTGLVVRTQRIQLAVFPAAIQSIVLNYDLGLAPAEIHRAMYNTSTGALVATPRRIWKGFIDKAPMPTAAIGGEASGEIILASAARNLTRGLTLTYSDAVQKQRGDDRFLKYADVSGVVRSPWGQTMPAEPAPAPARTPTPPDERNGGK